MRCKKCGEYIYKGKKFNARKETAIGEEYLTLKVFRFYIKCPVCSSEITFKTDPKQADFVVEHGATRNFENWAESDPTGKIGHVPGAEEDEEYDDEGNDRETRDAMADLERSQEQSRREMEVMDELADLRQRNARVETSKRADDPDALIGALHRAKEDAAAERRRVQEEEEDDLLVKQYFAKVGQGAPTAIEDGEGEDGDSAQVTIKRTAVAGIGEPSVGALLAARGKVAETVTSKPQIKRKRGDMQKLLGIKKKVKA